MMMLIESSVADCGCVKGKTATNYTLHGHRDGGCTECPGEKLYELIRTWSHYGGKLPHNCTADQLQRLLKRDAPRR